MRWFTTGLEIAGVAALVSGTFLVAGLGAALLAAGGLCIGASYFLSRGGSA